MTDLSMPATTGTTTTTRRLIAAGLIRRLPGRVLTLRATPAGVTGSITKTASLAELHRRCAEDYAAAAPRRTTPGQLLAAEPSGRRCPASFPTDPTPCRGEVAVTVLDSANHGADGCEYHAGILLASLDGGRVYALPDAPHGAATRVFQASTGGAR
ncbi:hypothetical protein ACGFS9_02980 [Streptomyces sp. NPDC048566]|uniref:hypothetical protein n=1 Tax=Streptomyces sp. NPDC048566 TaxID=3365569 RepID=UPI00371BBAC1